MEKIGIIGLGLIGGSFGLALKETGQYEIWGSDASPENLKIALERGLIDKVLEERHIKDMDGLILAVPVHIIKKILPHYLKKINPDAWIFDTGSIKYNIIRSVANHPQRDQFIASHPIAGTEYSGPLAARKDLFKNKINIICNPEESKKDLLDKVVDLHRQLGMETHFLDAREHDRHIAHVSHLSHVSAFMLGKTVADVEKDEKNIFLMAGSGFGSTVRLAKSSPDTWTPIFLENKKELIQVLRRYQNNLEEFITLLENAEHHKMKKLLKEINKLGTLIDNIEKQHGKR